MGNGAQKRPTYLADLRVSMVEEVDQLGVVSYSGRIRREEEDKLTSSSSVGMLLSVSLSTSCPGYSTPQVFLPAV